MLEQARLVLVRHGETVGNSSIRYYGRTDVALSELGRRQMRAARERLAEKYGARRFAPVFASPLVRAAEGARLIAGDGVAPLVIDNFVEVDFGRFEGLTAEEIAARYPDDYRRWNANKLAEDFVYPGGESRGAFAQRVAAGTRRMLELWEAARREGRTSAADAALLVAHRGVIREVVLRIADVVEPRIDLASIHIIAQENDNRDLREARFRPLALDDVTHLRGL